MAVAATVSLLYTLIYSSFAYILPGYQTFKAIERRGTEDVRQWAVYWVVLAAFYCSQTVFDLVLSWLPLYYVGKLAFIIALWHPNTQIAQSIYIKVLSPMLSTYEADVDKAVMDLRTKATDLVGQQAGNLRAHARQLSGQATVMLKNIQQKAADRARVARAPGGEAAVGHGLHTE